MSRKEDHTMFALSLRDINLLLDESMQRLNTFKVSNVTQIVPKDADPHKYLPSHYHDFLDVFDRNEANKLPPHRPWDHSIDLQSAK